MHSDQFYTYSVLIDTKNSHSYLQRRSNYQNLYKNLRKILSAWSILHYSQKKFYNWSHDLYTYTHTHTVDPHQSYPNKHPP